MHCGSRSWMAGAALGLWALVCTLVRVPAAAQVCDEDAGPMCEDDAGAEPPSDAGMQPAGMGGMSGSAGRGGSAGQSGGGGSAGQAQADACSCHAQIDDAKHGRIDVCTQGETTTACARFSCERGVVRDEPCSTRDVRLCCVMEARDLVSVLYRTCTHPNCVAGFSQQCDDFSGVVRGADCQSFVGGVGDDHDGGDGCAVARNARDVDLGLLFGVIALGLARRRSNRRAGNVARPASSNVA